MAVVAPAAGQRGAPNDLTLPWPTAQPFLRQHAHAVEVDDRTGLPDSVLFAKSQATNMPFKKASAKPGSARNRVPVHMGAAQSTR